MPCGSFQRKAYTVASQARPTMRLGIINYNGQAVTVEVTLEVYEFLDRVDHKTENLFHEQRRHWDDREFDEYIITTEGVGAYGETPEKYLCRVETLHELMAVLDTCTEA